MPATIPVYPTGTLVSSSIKIDNQLIPYHYPLVSIEVHHKLGEISEASLNFLDGAMAMADFEISDSGIFVPGKKVEILAGYNGEQSAIFTGIVVGQAVDMSENGKFRLIVSCKHRAIGMVYPKKTATFSEYKDSEIFEEVIKSYGIAAVITPSHFKNEFLSQNATSDWDFIKARAAALGFQVVCLTDGSIGVSPPNLKADPVLKLMYGASVFSFKASINANEQSPSIEAKVWESNDQEIVTETATEPELNTQGSLSPEQISNSLYQTAEKHFLGSPMQGGALKAWADSKLLRMRLSALTGTVNYFGNGVAVPGDLVELSGFGKLYSGNAYISSVNHTIDSGNWKSSIGFGLDAIENSQAIDPFITSGAVSAALQIATVENIYGDPLGEFRIEVAIKNGAEKQKCWARVANFYASSNAGAVFLPEVGDEVVLGFLDEDRRSPIVMGALYSSANPSPASATDNQNSVKSITTKSGLKISFDEDKRITTLTTPAGNTIILNDDESYIKLSDQHGSEFTMGQEGISLVSQRDIRLQAKGTITLNAQTDLKLSSGANLKLSALNIENQAQNTFSAKGAASAELSASGQTIIKGAIVAIN